MLIVEDEPLIRLCAVDLVEDAGFEAIEASTADEALSRLTSSPNIDVLFTDIDMPGSINGLELATIVKRDWPSIGIIVVSGYRRANADQIPEGGLFFAKPYDFGSVASAIRQLAQSSASLI
ncbi:response regulator (plasmid) [Rhizobium sp. NIBRBAC000502774]|nr:response regulator [Rhizobium sp. NIBRBAC000502774]